MNAEKIVTFMMNRNYDIALSLLAVHALTFMFYMGAIINNSDTAPALAVAGINLTALSLINFLLFGMSMTMMNIYIYTKGGKK